MGTFVHHFGNRSFYWVVSLKEGNSGDVQGAFFTCDGLDEPFFVESSSIFCDGGREAPLQGVLLNPTHHVLCITYDNDADEPMVIGVEVRHHSHYGRLLVEEE